MLEIREDGIRLCGPKGSIPVREDDEITLKLAMLCEGECEGSSAEEAAKKLGYTRQRYYQVLDVYHEQGAKGLESGKRGPRRNYRRTDEVIRQVIRYRFLDPKSTAEVIAQKLRQNGHFISTRSVERVISEYGLQKKTPSLSPRRGAPNG
jgi:transposase